MKLINNWNIYMYFQGWKVMWFLGFRGFRERQILRHR